MELPRGIGKPATRALNNEGITTLEQAASYMEAQLLPLHGVGPKAIKVLREAFAQHNLGFA
jgi:predicted flap endonuclease-1-like 5' DNA nuclease